MHPPRRCSPTKLVGFVCLLAASTTGCGNDCVGVGCQDDFAAALLNVVDGSETDSRTIMSPLESWAEVRGALDEGPNWDVLPSVGALVAGGPGTGRVQSFSLSEGDNHRSADRDGSILGDQPADGFGSRLARGQDLDGDGSSELVVSAPNWDRERSTRQNGGVFIFNQLSNGFSGNLDAGGQADWIFAGEENGAQFGDAVAACPDLDGDGRGELLIGAPRSDRGAHLAGAVYLAPGARLERGRQVRSDTLKYRWTGAAIGEMAGYDVSCSHDLLGDGLAELIVGAPFADGDHEAEGAIYVLDGATPPAAGDLSTAARHTLRGAQTNGWLGWAVATGDIDGDGLPELVGGAPGTLRSDSNSVARRGAGAALLWDGADLRGGRSPLHRIRLNGEQDGDSFGRSVTITDLDDDGYADLLVGAPRRTPDPDRAETFEAGALYLFRGAAGYLGWRPSMDAEDADLIWEEERQFLRTGQRVRAGDLTGDGRLDLILVNRSD